MMKESAQSVKRFLQEKCDYRKYQREILMTFKEVSHQKKLNGVKTIVKPKMERRYSFPGRDIKSVASLYR